MSTYKRETLRLYLWARVFGMISPIIRTISVRIPVAIPMAALPNVSVTNTVVREEAVIFTMLLPIRMVLISLLEFSVTFRTLFALLLPPSDSDLRENMLTVVSAVSADEKNADIKINIVRIIRFIMEPPKTSSPFIKFIYDFTEYTFACQEAYLLTCYRHVDILKH